MIWQLRRTLPSRFGLLISDSDPELTLQQLRSYIKFGKVSNTDLVWKPGFEDWRSAQNEPQIQAFFAIQATESLVQDGVLNPSSDNISPYQLVPEPEPRRPPARSAGGGMLLGYSNQRQLLPWAFTACIAMSLISLATFVCCLFLVFQFASTHPLALAGVGLAWFCLAATNVALVYYLAALRGFVKWQSADDFQNSQRWLRVFWIFCTALLSMTMVLLICWMLNQLELPSIPSLFEPDQQSVVSPIIET